MEEIADRPEIIPLDVYFSGKQHRVLFKGLAECLRRIDPDLILCNAEPENFLAFQVEHARRRLRRSVPLALISWRNIDYRTAGYPYKFSFLNERIEKAILPAVQAIISHTSEATEYYGRYGFDRIVAIPPSIDTTHFTPQEQLTSTAGSGVTIGFVGRFIPPKGGDLLLEALRSLPDDVQAVYVGIGGEAERWKQLGEQLGVSGRVRWRAPVRHEKMPEFYRSLDILVLPSRTGRHWTEQFGRVLIEAMACGVVVVGSSSGEIPRVIGNAGVVFPEGDAHALAAALGALCHDVVRRRELKRLGLARVQSSYSIEVVLPLYRHLFERLARGSL